MLRLHQRNKQKSDLPGHATAVFKLTFDPFNRSKAQSSQPKQCLLFGAVFMRIEISLNMDFKSCFGNLTTRMWIGQKCQTSSRKTTFVWQSRSSQHAILSVFIDIVVETPFVQEVNAYQDGCWQRWAWGRFLFRWLAAKSRQISQALRIMSHDYNAATAHIFPSICYYFTWPVSHSVNLIYHIQNLICIDIDILIEGRAEKTGEPDEKKNVKSCRWILLIDIEE